ncbi:MAG: tetratricopeptide repeat protein, partial [Acidobacteria bacterium]|nr:tetratricopeptide repeat protein [Acidobacteriota bacterium]
KNQFYCNFRADISLRNGEDIIFQYSREFPLYFPESDWDRVKANGLAVEDSFPIIEGKFKLSVLLTNTVGKQFSVLEKDVEVPPAKASPSIEGPFLGYRFETIQRDVHYPFKVNDRKLVTDPKKTYARADEIAVLFNVLNATEDLLRSGEARIVVRGLREANPVQKSYTLRLGAYPSGRILSISQSIPASDLDPDYYEILVRLVGADGGVLDEKMESFIVSPSPALGHPIANAKGLALANQFLYRYMLAQQSEKMNRLKAAGSLYEQAFQLNADYKEGVVMYGNFLNKVGAFEEALKVAEHLRADDRRQFPYHVIRGLALMGQEKLGDALTDLLLANRMYNSDTNVLNALGTCYQRMGKKAEALDAFKASLTLNPNQEAIKKLVEELSK